MNETVRRGRGREDDPSRYAAHDVIGYLLDNADQLSKAHGKIAEAILHHPTTFVERPIEDLVTWLGVSAPTITRFSRAIGCDGLRDLKLKVMSSLRVGMRYLEPLTPPDTLAEVQDRVVLRAQRAVLAAQNSIDLDMLDRVIDALTRSHMIYAFGSGGVSSWMVEEVHNRLFRLGLRITSSSDHQMQMMLAATAERGDVVFCSSLSGNNTEVIKAVRIAADYGATTVGLTVRDTPLARAVVPAAHARHRRRRRCSRPDRPALRLPRGRRHAGLWRGDPQRARAGETAAHQAAIHNLPGHGRHPAGVGLRFCSFFEFLIIFFGIPPISRRPLNGFNAF